MDNGYLIWFSFTTMIGMPFIWIIDYLGLYPTDREIIFSGDDFQCIEVEVSKLM